MSISLRVEISVGEAADKITILRIKADRIAEPYKLRNVHRELAILEAAWQKAAITHPRVEELTAELHTINETLWDLEDDIRQHERKGNFGETFIVLARQIYKTNDRRAHVKRRLNELTASALAEEKSYQDE
ncbi:MAG: hypothetical protein GKR94_24545 [Gammaproteobacteria bacterium]|nr:hypothetical protein [Gammaproteobacteria bacterium]